MAEIWSLSAICRCCHKDGQFKSLQAPYLCNGTVDVYSNIVYDTFGIAIKYPPFDASFSICEECISQLKQASNFKQQVIRCELKFEEYCKNELALGSGPVKVEVDYDESSSPTEVIPEADEDDIHEAIPEADEDDIHEDKNDVPLPSPPEATLDSDKDDIVKNEETSLKTEKTNLETKKVSSKRKETKNRGRRIGKNTQKGKTKRKIDKNSTQINLETNLTCPDCDIKFENEDDLLKHRNDSHDVIVTNKTKNEIKFICQICKQSFGKESGTDGFNAHMAKEHNIDRPHNCPVCDKTCITSQDLKAHLKIHDKNTKFTCDICKKNFSSKSSIIKHLKLMHLGTQKKIVCEICGRFFNDVTNYRAHATTVHEKQRPFPCHLCEKRFAAKKHLVVHIRHHTGERPFRCEICSDAFYTNYELSQHLKLGHSEKGVIKKTYNCKVCDTDFELKRSYLRHMRLHVTDLPDKCPICLKGFVCKYSMKRHIETHKGLKTFDCDVCNRKFATKSSRDRHTRCLHGSDEKFIKCLHCKAIVRNLERHMARSHKHKNANVKCSMCDKLFINNSALNRHFNITHLGVKKHVCGICGKKYTKSEGLRKHIEKKHDISKVESVDNIEDNVLTFSIDKS